jgi:hypothetical protein
MRSAGLLGLALAVCSLISAAGRPAEAARILVFNSTRYVDFGQPPPSYPEGSQESENVQAALASLGHTVTPIAGPDDPVGTCGPTVSQPGTLLASAAEYSAALATADAFLIPEQESWCYLPGEIPADVRTVWRNWVSGGGGLIVHSSVEAMQKVDDLFFVLFGFRTGVTAGTAVTTTKRAAAAATQFAGGPPTLPGNESTGLVRVAGLPAGSVSVYDNGTHASVAIIPFGSGKIIFLGWDWTKSNPPWTQDGQNGGWYPAIIQGAVNEAAAEPGFTLTVAKAGSGTGTVTSAPAGIDCGADCAQLYPSGTPVALTATPAAGAVFTGWSGDADCSDGSVQMTAHRSCTANFTAQAPGAQLSMVVRGTDNGIYHNRFNGAGWVGWVLLPGSTPDAPALASNGGMLELVVRGTDNGIYHNRFNGAGWAGWSALPGATSDTPALAVHGGLLHLVVRGTNDLIYHNRFDGTQWLGWANLPGATKDAPALAVHGGLLHLVVRGTDDRLYHNRFNGSAWMGWVMPAGQTADAPVLAANGTILELAFRGPDNGVYYNRFNGTGWLGVTQLTGATLNSPAVTPAGSGQLDLVVRGTDNGIWANHFHGTGWGGWIKLPGGTADAPALVTIGSGVHLLLRGTDNGIYHNQRPAGGSGSWLGFSAVGGATPSRPAVVAE